ncbi:hypothetical protein ACFVU2_08520 [Leifsonia sp. NPDC058194]|uniref:hypothetical protein n=1 Tax=Leifsonia sp. NPDC058194 TaxID=3346374 RepID=UPI0036DE4753
MPSTTSPAIVHAVRFSNTVRALRRLGVRYALGLPFTFLILADGERFTLVPREGDEPFAAFDASRIGPITVAERRERGLHPQVALALIVPVSTARGVVELPVVPIGDDGRRSLLWHDAEVRALANRITTALRGS